MDVELPRHDQLGLHRIPELIHTHLDQPMTVRDLAEAAGYSESHFARLFTHQVGITPARYLTAVRLAAAKQTLLEEAQADIIDVAIEVGFESLSSFTRAFRHAVGVTPGSFRRLADQLADHSVQPFHVGAPAEEVTVNLQAPAPVAVGLSGLGRIHVWLGWFPAPVPIGLPAGGILVEGFQDVRLPLCPGYPWLLGFSVPAHAEPGTILTPSAPIVGSHPRPITQPETITLNFDVAAELSVPMLPALPAMENT